MHAIRCGEDVIGEARPKARLVRTPERRVVEALFPARGGEATGAPLACLAGGALSRHFSAWRGVSGRRYVFSVFSIDAADLPELDDAVVIAAAVDAHGRRRLVRIGDTGRLPQVAVNGTFVTGARAAGATELHFRLGAPQADARRALIRDLWPRGRSSEIGGEPGERAVLEPEADEMLVRGPDIVGVVP